MWLINSSIGRKVVMALTGVALVLFLTFHMSMNVVALFSGEGYNMICEFLGANWYAVVATMGLAALCVLHIVYAFWLTMQNRAARGNSRYEVTAKPKGVEWASQNMLVLGIIVVLGLLLHLFNFWYNMMFAELLGFEGICAPADGFGWIHRMARSPLVSPHTRFLERNADIRLERQGMVQPLEGDQPGLLNPAHPRLPRSSSIVLPWLRTEPLLR